MSLPISKCIAAGFAGLASLTAVGLRGRRKENKSLKSDREPSPGPQRLLFREFIERYFSTVSTDRTQVRVQRVAVPQRKTHRWIESLNTIFFPLCTVALGVSFFFNPYGLIRFLSISGMIGFGTNWVAITMLFRPRHKHLLLPQGLVPKRRKEIIETMAETVTTNLISEEIIKTQLEESRLISTITADFRNQLHALIEQEAFRDDLRAMIETYMREFVKSPEYRDRFVRFLDTLLDRMSLSSPVGRIVTWSKPIWKDSALDEIDKWIENDLPNLLNKNLDSLDEHLAELPRYVEQQSELIEQWLTNTVIYALRRLDIKKTILKQLGAYDEEKIEKMIKDASNDQLRYITLLGGILGVLGGFVFWNPVALLWLAGGGMVIAAADRLLTPSLPRDVGNA